MITPTCEAQTSAEYDGSLTLQYDLLQTKAESANPVGTTIFSTCSDATHLFPLFTGSLPPLLFDKFALLLFQPGPCVFFLLERSCDFKRLFLFILKFTVSFLDFSQQFDNVRTLVWVRFKLLPFLCKVSLVFGTSIFSFRLLTNTRMRERRFLSVVFSLKKNHTPHQKMYLDLLRSIVCHWGGLFTSASHLP